MGNQHDQQKDWRETHFGVPARPHKARRRNWWLGMVLFSLVVLIGLLTADRFGLISLPSWWRSTAQNLPVVGPMLVSAVSANGSLANPVENAAGERQLRERVRSRERGISLMSRERAEVLNDLKVHERLRDEATARLRSIENTSTNNMTHTQIDGLRGAHANALAAAKNALLRVRQLSDQRDSLNRRIATAESERDAALIDLGMATPKTEAAGNAP